MTCSLEKSLLGFIVMTVLALSIVASKAISVPLELVSFRVIKLSTLESVSSVLSVFLMASVKVSVMFESLATLVAESAGLQVIVGAVVSSAVVSRAVNVIEDALMALFASSSTVVPIATYMTCSLEKSLSGLMVMTFLSESMVASKAISEPL